MLDWLAVQIQWMVCSSKVDWKLKEPSYRKVEGQNCQLEGMWCMMSNQEHKLRRQSLHQSYCYLAVQSFPSEEGRGYQTERKDLLVVADGHSDDVVGNGGVGDDLGHFSLEQKVEAMMQKWVVDSVAPF